MTGFGFSVCLGFRRRNRPLSTAFFYHIYQLTLMLVPMQKDQKLKYASQILDSVSKRCVLHVVGNDDSLIS
ncbi:hypothetical protein AVEN_227442-1, partial [Araneus ventricosus]